jgi:hypothetical protein
MINALLTSILDDYRSQLCHTGCEWPETRNPKFCRHIVRLANDTIHVLVYFPTRRLVIHKCINHRRNIFESTKNKLIEMLLTIGAPTRIRVQVGPLEGGPHLPHNNRVVDLVKPTNGLCWFVCLVGYPHNYVN